MNIYSQIMSMLRTLALLCLLACAVSSKNVTIAIIGTNDIHGAALPTPL